MVKLSKKFHAAPLHKNFAFYIFYYIIIDIVRTFRRQQCATKNSR